MGFIMSTRAIQYLKKTSYDFEIIAYDHEEKGAAFAARATGFPLNKTIKTLVAAIGKNAYVFALMPGDRQLDLKKLAHVCGEKKAAMADTLTAQRLTGYVVGGISPFGSRQRMNAVMDESLLVYDRVMINAGRRGLMLKMDPKDILDALNCRAFEISTGSI